MNRSHEKIGSFFYSTEKGRDFLDRKSIQRLREIEPFFAKEKIQIHSIKEALAKKNISLRTLDWLITNYSKKKGLGWFQNGRWISIHKEYKQMLRVWRRKMYDPFQRFARIWYRADGSSLMLSTTIGQLNFFYITTKLGLFKYIDSSPGMVRDIKIDMINHARKKLLAKKRGARKKLLAKKRDEISNLISNYFTIFG
jgi:hypothetical protein